MADFVKAAKTSEIEPGQARLVEVKGKQIALFRSAASSSPSTTPARIAVALWLRERCRDTK
jgi:hypothetical protein